MSTTPVLELQKLTKQFRTDRGNPFYAVKDVSFSIDRGECLGLVGESGCGKSTIARMITKLTEPTRGKIFLQGEDVSHISRDSHKEKVFRRVQMVFQDPYSVFSPRMPVGTFLEEGLVYHGLMTRKDAAREAKRLLELVELPASVVGRLPHQLSGGQQQRIAIARAISTKPALLILDEATSALDVSVQEDVLKLLVHLQQELQLTYLFICHDLAVVRSVADRIAVMYNGHLVELIESEHLNRDAAFPYTRKLLDSVFSIGDKGHKTIKTEELSLNSTGTEGGCPYAAQCPKRVDACMTTEPQYHTLSERHMVRCDRSDDHTT